MDQTIIQWHQTFARTEIVPLCLNRSFKGAAELLVYYWQHHNKVTAIISSISFGQDLLAPSGGDMSLRCTHPSALSHTALSWDNYTWPRSALFPKTLQHVHKQLINPQTSDDLAQEEERSVMLSCSSLLHKGEAASPQAGLGDVTGVPGAALGRAEQGTTPTACALTQPSEDAGGRDLQQQISEASVWLPFTSWTNLINYGNINYWLLLFLFQKNQLAFHQVNIMQNSH